MQKVEKNTQPQEPTLANILNRAFYGMDYFNSKSELSNYRTALCCKHALGRYYIWHAKEALEVHEINEAIKEEFDKLTALISFFQYIQKNAKNNYNNNLVTLAMLQAYNVNTIEEALPVFEELNEFTLEVVMQYSSYLIFEEINTAQEQETLLYLNKVHEFFSGVYQELGGFVGVLNFPEM